jgi:hypothetical protein
LADLGDFGAHLEARRGDLEDAPYQFHHRFLGPLGHVSLQHICNLRFSCFVWTIRFSKGTRMRRIDLVAATLEGWARLNPQQRERFFQAGLRAALRLERQELRAWLLRRIGEPPLAAPVDPARFAISKTDIALLMKAAREAPLK